jgi:hypothetical protein
MATQSTARVEPIVKKLNSISSDLRTKISESENSWADQAIELQKNCESKKNLGEQLKKLQEKCERQIKGLIESSEKEFALTLSTDASDTGKAMKAMFLEIGRVAVFRSSEPRQKGLSELEDLGLIRMLSGTDADQGHLLADINTPDIDPKFYTLTSSGKNIYNWMTKLGINRIIREEVKEQDLPFR